MARTKDVPLLGHPLVGKKVLATISADPNTGRKGRTVRAVLTHHDSTVLRLDKSWYWRTSITKIEEI